MRALNRVEVRERQAEGHKYGDDYKHHKQQNEWKLKPENRVFIHSLYNGGQAVLHRPYCSHVYFPLSASSSALISSTTWIL